MNKEHFTKKKLHESTQLFKEYYEDHILNVIKLLDIPEQVSRNDMARVLYILLTGETEPYNIKYRLDIDKKTGQVIDKLTELLSDTDKLLDIFSIKIFVSKAFGNGYVLDHKSKSEINDPENIRMKTFIRSYEIKANWLLGLLADMTMTGIDHETTNLILDRKNN